LECREISGPGRCPAERGNFPNGLRACGRKQLAADLEHAYEIGNLFGEFQRC